MARRSIPRPQPPVGGTWCQVSLGTFYVKRGNLQPYSRAFRKLSSTSCLRTLSISDLQAAAAPRHENIRFIIPSRLLASLLLESESLVEGVVQLGVGIRNFLIS